MNYEIQSDDAIAGIVALDDSAIDETSGGIDMTAVTIGIGVAGVGIAAFNAGYRSGSDRANRDNRGSSGGGGK